MFRIRKQIQAYSGNRILRFLMLIILIAVTQSLSIQAIAETRNSNSEAINALTPYSVEYILKSKQYKMSTKAHRSLSIDKNNVATLEQNASLFIAKVSQTSKFKLSSSACELTNINYRYERTIFGKHKSYKVDFDFNNKQLIENNDGKQKTLPLEKGFYDELSYQELLRCELMNNPEVKIGDVFEYSIRTKGKNKQYKFLVAGEEILDTRVGKLNTIKLTRERDIQDEDAENFFWFAKDYDYLVVKIYQKDDDDTLSLDINELNDD